LKTIKHILARYSAFLWALLKPLGAWGVFVVAALDGSFVGLPMDVVVAGYVYQNHAMFFVYVLMASAGSAVGSLVIYAIGYKGGEELLRKRIPPERFEKIHGMFERHPFWSLMFPAMLPPPTPFKLFVLAAAVSEMRLTHFLVAIFSGRFLRFFLLGLLSLKFGPGFVQAIREVFQRHFYWVLFLFAFALIFWLYRRRRSARRKLTPAI
jgi:membrane protein YqaA with SNARE-associated domain